jgi:hypothetical protein
VALLAALLRGAAGSYALATGAAFIADVEAIEESPTVAFDIRRVRLAAIRNASRAVAWRSRRMFVRTWPARRTTRRALPRFHRRGSPPRRGPPDPE